MLPPQMEAIARSLRLFDNNPTVDAHKVSVVYVGPGQSTEREILLNQQGSPAYWSFLRGLGPIRRLSRMKGFSAGLDTSGHDNDGRYTVRWRDLISQLVFHVGTLMPADEHQQEHLVRKKAHMGNDFVHIVFNESGREYGLDTIPSQFNFVQIIVTPVDGQDFSRPGDEKGAHDEAAADGDQPASPLFKVRTQIDPSVPFVGQAAEPKVLTLKALPAFVRSLAIHAVILSHVYTTCTVNGVSADYVSLWHARLQIIKRIRASAQRDADSRLAAQGSAAAAPPTDSLDMLDFGKPVLHPSQATTAREALGLLIRDLDAFCGGNSA
ncbi:Tuberous sclerosis 2-like protein [Coemansia spiralis]|nr:Tuberous sclerosis 2-like protein [Coemansia spiralis]